MDNCYSLSLILSWFNSMDIEYSINNANIGYCCVNHGVHVKINTEHVMSIQTHPLIAGPAFAETALFCRGKKVHTYGSDFVLRWSTPQDLFDHILDIRSVLYENT